jgi:hypothetical protein
MERKILDTNNKQIMKKITLIVCTLLAATVLTSTMLKEKKILRHVVLFKFKDSSSPEDVKKIEDAFRGLSSKIKTIKTFEWGTNVSPENLAQGFTHCFLVGFSSDKDRDDYLPHPDHKAFVALAGPHIDKVLVVDYWSKE